MRWQALFADLEAQAEAATHADLEAEVRDRTRRETALLALRDRLGGSRGAALTVAVLGADPVRGRLLEVGPDWLLLEEDGAREVLVPTASVLSLTGLGPRAEVERGQVADRLDLRWALRALARDRAGVALVLREGTVHGGTLDRVGADHVELAEHAPGEARRASAVRGLRLVPLSAVGIVRRAA